MRHECDLNAKNVARLDTVKVSINMDELQYVIPLFSRHTVKMILIIALVLVASAMADNNCHPNSLQNLNARSVHEMLFRTYLKSHDKKYCDDEEYKMRHKLFQESVNMIFELQKEHPTTKFALNHMSDWTKEEYKRLNGFVAPLSAVNNSKIYIPRGNAPETWDWRKKGVVTKIKDQGQCADCYIFAAVGAIESAHAIQSSKLVSLSEQFGLDCLGSGNCQGGWPVQVMKELGQIGGIEPESVYPYEGRKAMCRASAKLIAVKVKGGAELQIRNEEALKDAVYNEGPLAIAMEFGGYQLRNYGGGIIDPTDCGHSPDHALILVGYGTENGTPYWIIKNSWGTSYGEKGYIRIIRGKKACSILSNISKPNVS